MRRPAAIALTVALAVGGVGCADPHASSERRPPGQTTSPAPITGDAKPVVVTARAPHARMAGRARQSPAVLARVYAQLVISWDWRSLTGRLERAQSLASGALREELVHTIEMARADESLRRDRTGALGRVVSVATNGAASTRQLVVVTSEQALRDGRATLEGPRARVYTGTARRTSGRWRMVAWELEP